LTGADQSENLAAAVAGYPTLDPEWTIPNKELIAALTKGAIPNSEKIDMKSAITTPLTELELNMLFIFTPF